MVNRVAVAATVAAADTAVAAATADGAHGWGKGLLLLGVAVGEDEIGQRLEQALDGAALATPLDAFVGIVVHLEHVLDHIAVLGRQGGLIRHGGDLGGEGLGAADVEVVLVLLWWRGGLDGL